MIGLEDELNISMNANKEDKKALSRTNRAAARKKKDTTPKFKPLKQPPLKMSNDKKRNYYNELQAVLSHIECEEGEDKLIFIDVFGGDGIIDYWIHHYFKPNAKVIYNDANGMHNKMLPLLKDNYADYFDGIEVMHKSIDELFEYENHETEDDTVVIYIIDGTMYYNNEILSKFIKDETKNIILFDNTACEYINVFNACTGKEYQPEIYHDPDNMIYTRIKNT